MKQIYKPSSKQFFSNIFHFQFSFFVKRTILSLVLLQIYNAAFVCETFGQEVQLTGTVVNSNLEPVSNVRVNLQSIPDIFVYTDEIGNFSLVIENLGISDLMKSNESVYLVENGGIIILSKNSSLSISIYDLMGRDMGTIVNEKNLNGNYIVYPSSYIKQFGKGIYIAHVKLGNYHKAIKFFKTNDHFSLQGLHNVSSTSIAERENISLITNRNPDADETLVFDHDFYKTTYVMTSNLISDLGIVELDNFGDYTIPQNMVPDKADLYNTNGTVLNLFGKDSTEFTLHFNPYSIFDKKLTLKAIPIDELEGLDPSIEIISAVHLEPSGTKFNIPGQVHLDIADISSLENLVVFLYDDTTDKTYYIPYLDESGIDFSIGFYISHFSDIGIGYLPEFPVDSGEPLTSDDFVTEINYHIYYQEEVPVDLFTIWFEQIVLPAIDAVSNIENLQYALNEVSMLNAYINLIDMDIADFGFYDELTSSLGTKISYVFAGINNECQSNSDLCTKINLARIALTLVKLTQQIDGIDSLDYTSICNGEVLEMVVDFIIEDAMVNIEVSEQTQIYIEAQNILKDEISSDGMNIEWTSEDPSIASVNQLGTVTGISQGTVKVIAKYCDIERHVIVNVGVQNNYCYSHTHKASGSVSTYGYHSTPTYKARINTTKRISVDFETGVYTGKYYSSYHTQNYLYNSSTGSYHWVTSFDHISGFLGPWEENTVACDEDFEFYQTAGYHAGTTRLYPQWNLVKTTSQTFYDQYLSGEGPLEEQ